MLIKLAGRSNRGYSSGRLQHCLGGYRNVR
jgi:hypothetical protein